MDTNLIVMCHYYISYDGSQWTCGTVFYEAKGGEEMIEWLSSPFFGILISLFAFECAVWIQKKTRILLCNPLLLSIVFVIAFLLLCDIDVAQYQEGGQIIDMFLGPITVALAIPLYRQLQSLKNFMVPILLGILLGSIAGMLSILICAGLFQFEPEMMASLLPKSVTTPIGIEISAQLGGIPSITVLNILVTGILGSMMADIVFRIFAIKDPVAKGIALGTSAHAVGTSKALQLGHIEGAMSSLAIGVAGLMTVFLAPILWNLVVFLG